MATELTRNDPVVFHFRVGLGEETKPKAGATVVFLPDQRRFGLSLCCTKDRYNKKIGVAIATARAKVSTWALADRSRRQRRFPISAVYDGPQNIEAIRAAAYALAHHAAEQVENPVQSSMETFKQRFRDNKNWS